MFARYATSSRRRPGVRRRRPAGRPAATGDRAARRRRRKAASSSRSAVVTQQGFHAGNHPGHRQRLEARSYGGRPVQEGGTAPEEQAVPGRDFGSRRAAAVARRPGCRRGGRRVRCGHRATGSPGVGIVCAALTPSHHRRPAAGPTAGQSSGPVTVRRVSPWNESTASGSAGSKVTWPALVRPNVASVTSPPRIWK
jgi:hypothetical protein